MPALSELELLRDLTVAQRVRIAELEQQLREAQLDARSVRGNLRAVKDGLNQTLSGILPAPSVAIIDKAHDVVLGSLDRLDAHLRTALSRPHAGPPAEPEPLPENVHPILRRRAERRASFYEDVFGPVRTSAQDHTQASATDPGADKPR